MSWNSRLVSSAVYLLVAGCGSSDSSGSATETDGATSSGGQMSTSSVSSGATTTEASTTSGDSTTASVDGSSSGGQADESSATSQSAECMVWAINYDLTGSTFELSGTPLMAGDQVNTVMEPYDQDDHVGPGAFVLHFEDVDGSPGGLASMVSYSMTVNFVVAGATTVTTDLMGVAGPDDCGVTQGLVNEGTVAWAPPQIVGYTSKGTVLCEGALCAAGGLPNGEPVDMGSTSDQLVGEFVFADDFTSFTMAETVISMDATSTQSWTYMGTETSRELVSAPACACQS